jgi:phage shock protein A
MSIFTRFTDIVNANINGLLDKAENPEKMIRLIIQEMEETLVEVRSTAARSIAEKKTLLRQIRSLDNNSNNWHEKATLAITKQREDLARAALAEKQKCQAKATELHAELSEIDQHLAAVQDDSQRLQDKLHEAKRKQDSFALRQQSVEVRLKVKEQGHIAQMDNAIAKFERYQQKIDRLEAELEAYDLTENKDLESQFRELAQDEQLEQELAALKKQVVNG